MAVEQKNSVKLAVFLANLRAIICMPTGTNALQATQLNGETETGAER
jgi:hypothetical protein